MNRKDFLATFQNSPVSKNIIVSGLPEAVKEKMKTWNKLRHELYGVGYKLNIGQVIAHFVAAGLSDGGMETEIAEMRKELAARTAKKVKEI